MTTKATLKNEYALKATLAYVQLCVFVYALYHTHIQYFDYAEQEDFADLEEQTLNENDLEFLELYALNNPIRYVDPSGQLAISTVLLILAFAFVIGFTASLVYEVVTQPAGEQSFGQAVARGVMWGGIAMVGAGLIISGFGVIAGAIGYITVGSSFVIASLGMLGVAVGTTAATVVGGFFGLDIRLYGSSNKSTFILNRSGLRARNLNSQDSNQNMPYYYWLA